MSGRRKAHHSGSYQRIAATVRAQADANPATRCWQCGKTKAEHGRKWQAGHVHDGQADGPLLPECQRCNSSRGATLGNTQRRTRTDLTPTRRW